MTALFPIRVPGDPQSNPSLSDAIYALSANGWTIVPEAIDAPKEQIVIMGSRANLRRADALEMSVSRLGVMLRSTAPADTDSLYNALTAYRARGLDATRTIALAGQLSGSLTTDFSTATATLTASLVASGVVSGTYSQVVVDSAGRVTAGANPGFLTSESDTLATVTARGTSSASTLNVAGLVTTGNITVGGNLLVNGTTTTVNTTQVTIDDPLFILGGVSPPTLDDNRDRGIEFRWHDGATAKLGFFGFRDTTRRFAYIPDATNTADVITGALGTIEGVFVGPLTGTASAATALAAAQPIAVSGDATGSSNFSGSSGATIALTLANSGVAAGTYQSLVVNAKGLVTSGAALSGAQVTTALGYTPVSNSGTVAAAQALAVARSIVLSGDVSGNASFDGTANATIAATLPNIAAAGTYTQVVVNAKGQVTSGTFGLRLLSITSPDDGTGQSIPFITDARRSNKNLSVETQSYSFFGGVMGVDEWFLLHSQVSAQSGYPMPYAGTITRLSVSVISTNGNARQFSIYVNGTENASVVSIAGSPETQVITNNMVNIDFAANDILRMRVRGGTLLSTISDVVATLHVRWRV